MAIQITIPSLGDSVSEAVLTKWLKNDGEFVNDKEAVAELETDKANVDLPSPGAGVFKKSAEAGTTVKIGQVVGSLDPDGKASASPPAGAKAGGNAPQASAATVVPPQPAAAAPCGQKKGADDLSPAPRRIVAENGLDAGSIQGTGPGGRVTKEDATAAASAKAGSPTPSTSPTPTSSATTSSSPTSAAAKPAAAPAKPVSTGNVPPLGSVQGLGIKTGDDLPFDANGIKRVPMSKIRKKIAERLVQAQHTAAILHTYNEVDLTEVMALRAKHKEGFEKQFGVGLGFMSFFTKAVCSALKSFPKVNAQIDGDDLVYQNHVHMGIAVSTERGLVVPVLRNAHAMSFAQIEAEIKRLALAARDGKLAMDEMSGGTFTITNGGVFGSLLSAPIINPPQSGILGMHTIQKRPMVVNDQIVIRNMMYIVLGYDHRVIDGKDSVSFLVKLKQLLEDPSRLMLDL